jgi:hypothetical protein
MTFRTPPDARRLGRRLGGAGIRRRSEVAQSAIVLVVAVAVLMMTTGVLLIQQSSLTDPLLSADTIQHYSYRALEAGVNTYQSVVNADPNLANCSNLSNGSAICQNAQYDTWNLVHGTDIAGQVPEYYLFDNPQPIFNADGSLNVLKVQVVGAAGFPGKYIYQSSTLNLASVNGFLDNIWWSDLESTTGTVTNPVYRSPGTPAPGTVCQYGYTGTTGAGTAQSPYVEEGPTSAATTGNCHAVVFETGDILNGPIFSNDTIYILGTPTIGTAAHPVETADPYCGFVSSSNYQCATDSSGVSDDHQLAQTPPSSNTELDTVASEATPNNGCVYDGPTSITLAGASGMTVISPDTTTVASGCPLNGTGPLPPNGVVYVANVPSTATHPNGLAGANPFDDTGTFWGYPSTDNGKYAQTSAEYSFCSDYANPADAVVMPCYFGGTQTPDAEGDAFVNGSLKGLLTVGAANDIFVDGNITYSQCTTWKGTAHESACTYNGSGKDDSLGLIASNYVEVNHPINTDDATCTVTSGRNPTTYNWYTNASTCSGQTVNSSSLNTLLPNCGSNGADPAPLCEPVNPITGVGSATSVVIDGALLALSQSVGADNYGSGGLLGSLVVYGSLEQESRGAIAVAGTTGFTKYYTWDPRLEIAAPPSYLTPGTDSYDLLSSSINTVLTCPALHAAYSSTGGGTAPTCTTP